MGLVFCFATYARKTACLARKFSHCKCPVWFLFEPEKVGKLMKIFANTHFHLAIKAIFKLDRAMQITWKNLELASSLESLNQGKSCRFPQCAQTLRNSWSKLKELLYIKKINKEMSSVINSFTLCYNPWVWCWKLQISDWFAWVLARRSGFRFWLGHGFVILRHLAVTIPLITQEFWKKKKKNKWIIGRQPWDGVLLKLG